MAIKKPRKATFFIFLHFSCEFFAKIEYIGIARNAKKKEVEMSNQTEEQFYIIQRSLDKIIAELEKVHKSELAMRWLCSYGLEAIKK